MTTSTDNKTTQTQTQNPLLTRRTAIKATIAGLAVAGAAFTGVKLFASTSSAPKTSYFATDGVALAGYDVVAYFADGGPKAGSKEFETTYDGVTWRFASQENLNAFAANPTPYLPAYGGYCAWGLAAKDQLFPIDPNAWSIIDGRLYLNFNADVQAMWLEAPSGFITTADKLWPGQSAALAAH